MNGPLAVPNSFGDGPDLANADRLTIKLSDRHDAAGSCGYGDLISVVH